MKGRLDAVVFVPDRESHIDTVEIQRFWGSLLFDTGHRGEFPACPDVSRRRDWLDPCRP